VRCDYAPVIKRAHFDLFDEALKRDFQMGWEILGNGLRTGPKAGMLR
jgi:hypothetical protein